MHGMEKVLPSMICYVAIQTYVTLCCSKEWKEEWKGVKFPCLYVLLHEQFAHSDDPWCAETLKWWNEYALSWSVPSSPHTYTSLGKYLITLLIRMKNLRKQSKIHGDHPRTLAWTLSDSRGSEQPLQHSH